MPIFPYKWYLKDGFPAKGIPQHLRKVFSTFSCGGGSSMGYKLTGYDVIGFNEINKKFAGYYKQNLSFKYDFIEDIRNLTKKKNLPKELFQLDILDGSPPCTPFSIAGNGHKDWGKEKKFNEGCTLQLLDDLFFYLIELAGILRPKMVVAENVPGILIGRAKKKVLPLIFKKFEENGYIVSYYLLDSSKMNVPQKRKRVFFIALNEKFDQFVSNDGFLNKKINLNLYFNMPVIKFENIKEKNVQRKNITPSRRKYINEITKYNVMPCGTFGHHLYQIHDNIVFPTLLANHGSLFSIFGTDKSITHNEMKLIGTFPMDYECKETNLQDLIGYSVPPIMMAHVAWEIYKQILSKI